MRQQNQTTIANNFFPITFVPLLNLLCLLFMVALVAPYSIFPNSVGIKMPKAITSDIVPENTTAITVTSEDIIYFGNKIISDKELKKLLESSKVKNQSILIKAEGRTSLGRIIDIWNVCRQMGIEKVNLASTVSK